MANQDLELWERELANFKVRSELGARAIYWFTVGCLVATLGAGWLIGWMI